VLPLVSVYSLHKSGTAQYIFARPTMTTTMIYTTSTQSQACAACRKIRRSAAGRVMPRSHLDTQVEFRSLASMSMNNKSLVFGAAIVRQGTCIQQCLQAAPAINLVNRLWYGRALVYLRTYQQESLRVAAREQKSNSRIEVCNAIAA
jgi:hypothetical protein